MKIAFSKDLKDMQSAAVPCVVVNENSIFKDLNVMQSTAVWIALLYLLIFVFFRNRNSKQYIMLCSKSILFFIFFVICQNY